MRSFSYSQIKTFLQSSEDYYTYYIKKEKQPFSFPAYFGTLMHNTLYRFYEQITEHSNEIGQGNLFAPAWQPSFETLWEIYEEMLNQWSFLSPPDKLKLYTKGKESLERFYNNYKDNWGNPWLLEVAFQWNISPQFSIKGRYDRVDRLSEDTALVIDYKSHEFTPDAIELYQLAIYKYALLDTYPYIEKVDTALEFLSTGNRTIFEETLGYHEFKTLLIDICNQIENFEKKYK